MMIRRAEPRDLAAVDRLLSQVLAIHAEIRPDLFIPGTRKYTDSELLTIFADERSPVFVAEDADGVQGYCFCQLQERRGLNNMPDGRELYIDDLCVDEAARGRQVGRQLYDYVCAYAKNLGCGAITLNVWEGNSAARAFYERMGMTVRKTVMETKL
jgi:ribosomal protein S18 acetylase RimI-like enzyme